MNVHRIFIAMLTLLLALPLGAQDSAITYQGRLKQQGAPFTGTADLRFRLFDAASGGNAVSEPIERDNWPVEDGLFQVDLDFGADAFGTEARWLQIRVNGTSLSPRQPVRPAPLALYALSGNQGPAGPPGDSHWGINGGHTYYVNGSVGIGISSPAFPLHVDVPANRVIFARTTAGSGQNYGVWGQSNSTTGRGVLGYASATSGAAVGVSARSDSTAGRGVFGWASATSGETIGVSGQSDSTTGTGVFGWAAATSGSTIGVYGRSDSGSSGGSLGVYGYATHDSGPAFGVKGVSESSQGMGVWGVARSTSGSPSGVHGLANDNGWAVYSSGRFGATGTKSFVIDHPHDPENQYLLHYTAEGPEPYNVYNGNVVLNGTGEVRVELPDYFEDINRDYRYQLTAIGAPGPNLHVAREIEGNGFLIAGGEPGMKVSWSVTALRDDPWVQHYPTTDTREKPEHLRGTYQHPELYGQPPERGEMARFDTREDD